MNIIPLKFWRPASDSAAEQLSCPPYDVISTAEARRLAEGNAVSFLHVIRPEIGFREGMNEHHPSVYDAGASALRRLMASRHLVQDETPSLYVYQLEMGGIRSTGVFGGVRTHDYDSGTIVKHENTRPDKEDDRTRHIVAQRAHAEPVMLVHPSNAAIASLLNSITTEPPLLEVIADGVAHRLWNVEHFRELTDAFASVSRFYVADGHHRCAAAARASVQLEEECPGSGVFPAAVFPSDQMQLMAYNRVILDVEDGSLDAIFSASDVVSEGCDVPDRKGDVCVYQRGVWKTIRLADAETGTGPVDRLDVQRLHDQILAPILRIGDPRTDPNISFVGGIRGPDELRKLVDNGRARVAFSMYPTSVQELMEVSDAGLLMPPKSTWFEPKLRSGLLVNVFC